MTDLAVSIETQPSIVVQVGDVSAISLLYAGTVALPMTAGETLVYGDVCYVKAADGKLWKAQADGTAAEAEAQFICIVTAGIAANVSGLFAGVGAISTLSGGTAGSLGYLSATAGGITTTAPTTAGHYSKILGRWISSTLFWFSPDPNTYHVYAP